MATKIKPAGKFMFIIAALGGIVALKFFVFDKFLKSNGHSQKIEQIDLPTAPKNAKGVVPALQLPSGSKATNLVGSQFTFEVMGWNSQMGLMYAVGDETPVQGSLMAKAGVNVKLLRNDDCNQMAQNLISFAKNYKSDKNATGTAFIALMGDGTGAAITSMNKELTKLGKEYKAEIIWSCGRSNGEDQFMGQPSWRSNPQAAKGALIATVVKDGDWNIVCKWAGDNNIRVNPDETTYDPEAINFVNAKDFVEAGNMYIANQPVMRDVVVTTETNGVFKSVRTGEKKSVAINGVSTWTPGDVNVAEKRGGLVTIVSTKQYSGQMPNAVIGIKKWNADHKDTVLAMLDAIGKGGDQVRCYSGALDFAGAASSRVYKAENGAYWVKYYKGYETSDKQGLTVQLGGSMAFNLADNIELFGVNGGNNNMATVYKTFGRLVSKLYPSDYPSIDAAEEVVNSEYVKALANRTPVQELAQAETQSYNAGAISQKISSKAWSIEFASGSDKLTPASIAVLREMAEGVIIAKGCSISVEGHTDNAGTPEGNDALSVARANAVKRWLMETYRSEFPTERITTSGKGQREPVADNSSKEGQRKNRRVVIVIGQ